MLKREILLELKRNRANQELAQRVLQNLRKEEQQLQDRLTMKVDTLQAAK